MQIGVADARRRFREVLDAVEAGETVEVTRRGEVVAVIGAPATDPDRRPRFADHLEAWRTRWDVASWPDDDPFADVRDSSEGRPPPW